MNDSASPAGNQINKRSAARLAIVQALYQMDTAGSDVEDTIAEFEQHRLGKETDGSEYLPVDAGFFAHIVRQIIKEQLSLDPLIDDILREGWPLVRIDLTLRQILRAGLYEIMHRRDIPAKVAISEYVNVAYAFFDNGDEVKMTNAVLDQLARKLRDKEFT